MIEVTLYFNVHKCIDNTLVISYISNNVTAPHKTVHSNVMIFIFYPFVDASTNLLSELNSI